MTAPLPPANVTLRGRLLDAAVRLTATEGWSAVTMARLAAECRVSRQTVYNEIGAKPALAEAMVLDQLARFMAVVESAFESEPDDPVEALRTAVRGVLELAQDNPLLKAVVSASHGADTDLLPLLTTHGGPLLHAAQDVVLDRVRAYDLGLDDDELRRVSDLIVRSVLSHVMQTDASPAETADALAWVAARVLR